MAIDDLGVLVAAIGIAVVIGFMLGKLSAAAKDSRSSSQRITQNEIKRWKINSKYAVILTDKNPSKIAELELNKLNKLKQNNLEEMEEIEVKLGEFIDKLEDIRKEANLLNSPAQIAAKRETAVSLWSGRYTELRQEVQDCNNANISHGYNKRFLKFIVNDNVKPGLIELMDGAIIDDEIMTAGLKKNLALTEAVMKGMTSEADEYIDSMMGFER
jgi:hypothetical protein